MWGANRGLPNLCLPAIGQPGLTGATHSALLWGRKVDNVYCYLDIKDALTTTLMFYILISVSPFLMTTLINIRSN